MAFPMAVERWLDVARMDELARQGTPVHRIDARAQTVTTLLFIGVVMSFARDELSALMPFFIYPVALMSAGRIPAASLLRKLAVAMPFAVAVGLLNPVFDTRPALALGPLHVSSGWLSFLSIMLRCLLTVSAALLLVACTGMQRLCEGLVRLGVPRVFAVQLLFLYRYLFLLADEGRRMTRGIELRSPGVRGVRFRVYVSLIGHLLLRAMARAERIYHAMQARGFDGRIRLQFTSPLRLADPLFVGGWTLFFAVARVWNLAEALGALLMKGVG
ncbi:MAG: Energy-coupling factor transporter transmembrane protein EcfT [Verrucomicrobia bacterium ADurb.Bin070]|jgi:cobalt/nickel transport system permease protein|nr:MAG: Energy-coupling factor transporter transmembrane protein EcfT [Verrucomicrobia bacterium ADurb.Bin070]